MIYELRFYTAVPGRELAILNRFRDSTFAIFERIGIKVFDFWKEENGNLWYLLEWESREAQARIWPQFQADPEWQKVRAETEKNGPIVEKIESFWLSRPEFVRPSYS